MTTDFLIIGGGIAGVSAAARLSHLGSVTLVEGETALAWHASGRSAALYEPGYGRGAVNDLTAASGSYLAEANGGVLSPRGLLLVGGPGEDAAFAEEAGAMNLARIPVDEARALVPILSPERVTMAAHTTRAQDIDTDLLIQNFAREARANGARLETGRRVTGIERLDAGWRVVTAGGDLVARVLINAAGAWADDVARIAGVVPLGLRPFRRSMARIPAPGRQDVAGWPMVFGAGETWYMKPDAGALIVSPAEEHPMEPHDAWADDMVLAEGLARYEEFVTEPVTRLLASWAGLRTFAPDRVLVIGEDPEVKDFYWLAGQGGYGFQTCAAASRHIADLIGGCAPEIGARATAALSPARLR
ncbi:NAD(P)/FAD-dependent oxidoreductase [Albidovulum sediminicola]|uniref:FAD-binding oxidoreductase n=1 Tax=Albidovulum sediminicola TaxID=2984331 RepID=A0ABT2Z2A3_9RHOB|nr:FAD-dependent oxidoreductase [Defluviimonas sp. WL0075]MCV2865269.1 FAD-binding oxidoreductase [Defluviimonas sp. WL0075]